MILDLVFSNGGAIAVYCMSEKKWSTCIQLGFSRIKCTDLEMCELYKYIREFCNNYQPQRTQLR